MTTPTRRGLGRMEDETMEPQFRRTRRTPDQVNYEDGRITVGWWQKDGQWHYAIREEPGGPKRWQAPDDGIADRGGYESKAAALKAARAIVEPRGW